ncbi:mobilization protein MobA, partial [Salmonella enterica]|nr:mobilization protein MobA [Salmonella enterica]
LSENAIVCAVADDIATVNIDGFESRVNRDGVIQYLQDGHVVIQDSGERIEIADPYREDGIHISDAMLIAEEKSGEKLVFSGDGRFVNSACDVVQWFNEGGSNPLPLTDPQQRVRAGYERPESSAEQPVFTHRIMDEETYLASLKREDAAASDDRNKPEPGKNTYRPG